MTWTNRVCPRDWAPAHLLLEGFTAGEPLFSPEALFEAFVAAREVDGPGKIYFNHEIERNVFSRQRGAPTRDEDMPAASDGSWTGYAERMKKAHAGARFCLRLTELHAYSSAIYTRLCKLLSPLDLGDGKRCVRTTVFVGDYDYTPFGVHVDPYPQIQCVISGGRTALFWDSEYWGGRTEEERLAPWDHLEAAHRVPLKQDDAVYWAAAYEHAFSAQGELGIALTISFPPIPAPENEVEEARRRSAHHFLNVPAPRAPRTAKPEQRFLGHPLFPLTIVSEDASEIVIVGAGSAFAIPRAPSKAPRRAVSAFVARVNERSPFRVSDVDESVRELVDVFWAHYCIEAVD